eukprot:CAMPEP_0119295778 /NCGR_PEP_ID=MMETSP1329-20130426/50235_1 /TAXON_ID=114041 /ORGANISM="Genus nov. species nov., Strain RCC1024" /LENGTH=362 /DNA_ID=CAMNT_0007296697 /DNA_START=47 /DNA_END=1137 /DNA_ORIENTATION=-
MLGPGAGPARLDLGPGGAEPRAAARRVRGRVAARVDGFREAAPDDGAEPPARGSGSGDRGRAPGGMEMAGDTRVDAAGRGLRSSCCDSSPSSAKEWLRRAPMRDGGGGGGGGDAPRLDAVTAGEAGSSRVGGSESPVSSEGSSSPRSRADCSDAKSSSASADGRELAAERSRDGEAGGSAPSAGSAMVARESTRQMELKLRSEYELTRFGGGLRRVARIFWWRRGVRRALPLGARRGGAAERVAPKNVKFFARPPRVLVVEVEATLRPRRGVLWLLSPPLKLRSEYELTRFGGGVSLSSRSRPRFARGVLWLLSLEPWRRGGAGMEALGRNGLLMARAAQAKALQELLSSAPGPRVQRAAIA